MTRRALRSILAAALLSCAAGQAGAQGAGDPDYIIADPYLPRGSHVTIRMIRSSEPGRVIVVDPLTGDVLGERDVPQGLETGLRVILGRTLMRDAVALLVHGDQIVAQERLNIVSGNLPFPFMED